MRAREVACQRIVAAGVEQHNAGLGLPFHLLEDERQRQAFEIGIAFTGEPRVDRHEIVLPPDRHAMARIEEQGKVGAGQLDAELADHPLHGSLVEVMAFKNLEAQPPQRRGHVGGIVLRVLQFRRILIG